MRRQRSKVQILSLSLVLVFMFGIIPQGVMAGQMLPEDAPEIFPRPFPGYDLAPIYIFYDPGDEILSAVATAVHEILSYRVNGVVLIPVSSLSDIQYWLQAKPWIAIYALRTGVNEVVFSERNATWAEFHQVLTEYRSSQHVIGTGNTLSLKYRLSDLDTNVHHSDSEQIDGMLLILYDVWTVADIVEQRAHIDPKYDRASKDLKSMAIKLYGDNMQEFVGRTLEPVDIVGEEDPEALARRTEEMWARHAPRLEKAAYEMRLDGSLEELPLADLPSDFSPMVKLSSPAELASTDFILGEIPLFSALNGPIGEIIDVLLDVLMDEGQTVISIPSDVMDSLAEAFEVIEPLIGIVSDFDADSPLKSVIDALASEFPFIEEYKDYLNILLKALFNLRGDWGDLVEILLELVEALLPEVIPSEVTDFLFDLLGVGSSLSTLIDEVISEGKGVFDTLFGFFTKNALQAVLNKTLTATLSLLPSQVSTLLPRLVAFVSSAIDFLTTKDFGRFVEAVGDDLLSLIPDISGYETVVEQIMSVFNMAMTAAGLVDSFDADTIVELVKQMLNELVPSGMVTDVETFARSLLNITKVYKESPAPDLNSFKTQLLSVVEAATSGDVSTQMRQLIRDVITLLAGFYIDGFDKNQLPDLFEIAEGLINELVPASHGAFTLSDAADLIEAFNDAVRPILGIIAMVSDSDSLKQMVSKTVSGFESELGNLPQMIMHAIEYLDIEDYLASLPDVEEVLSTVSEIAGGVINLIQFAKDQSFQGIMQSLLMSAGSLLGTFPSFDQVPLDPVLTLLKSFFPKAFGIDPQSAPSATEVINQIMAAASPYLSGIIDPSLLQTILEFFMDIKGIFTDGVKWMVGKILDWLTGMLDPLFDELESMIEGLFAGMNDLLGYSTTLPIGLGEWSLFDLSIALGIRAEFNIDLTPLSDLITSMIFDARSTFSISNIGDFFKVIFSFFEITPQFYAELGVCGFDSSKNAILGLLMEMFGLEFSFEGSAKFVLNLFTFRNGMFEWEDFMRVVEWALHIKIALGKTFTLADIFTAGLGGGALAAVMEFLGLDMISITIWLAVELDIVKKAASAIAPEVSTLTLAVTFGISIHIPLDLLIVAIIIDGSLEIILTFFQDLSSNDPMKITLRLMFTVKVTFRFLFFDDDASWTWEPGGPWDLSPKKTDEEFQKSGVGFDTDDDGLSDEYEESVPGLDPNNPDTDGDGANDKLEVQTMYTDPVNPDTDGDGLLDGEEWDLGTNPRNQDTDWDDLTDYEEVRVYGTSPFAQDTDGDHLTDAYEVYTRWDLTECTPTVEYVVIGGVKYDDHTDPLNPDTDGDTLLDGQEGPGGAYYGLDSLYNETAGSGSDPSPLIFNYGYTHPLDADTDDDSYLQLYNGDIDHMLNTRLHPAGTEGQEWPMNDGAEVRGFDIILYDDEGEPYDKHVYTNPCNPDTDGDTGVSEADRTNPPPGAWLNSDGYELCLDPPSDPTDGDSDDDGLLDGLEGVLRQDSNHTFYLDADTDDDGLPDMTDLLLGTDPLSPDTDLDMVADGDEFFRYGTSPTVFDSDFDGLSDGEELFFWHSNPMADDSDGDSLSDGFEVLYTGSDPMDEDSDNDGLTDFEEFFVYYTDCFVYDTDGDGLSDGEEIKTYLCDPLNWDTDMDSITQPNEYGDMTWPMSDYDEVMLYHTNVTSPDSDLDGLDDAIELYLASGLIPYMDPVLLDPLDKDTDDDWLADGSELFLENVTGIIYPYQIPAVRLRYNTSPVVFDSDNDTLSDYQEVVVFNSNPSNNDTDNDTISDWYEIWVYNTSALQADTDGDGLYDDEETLTEIWPYGSWPPENWSTGIGEGDNGTIGGYVPPFYLAGFSDMPPPVVLAQALYATSATDPDSDNDGLPDGAEVLFYESDPMDTDSDNDGIPDTLEFDTDFDGLPDGIEFGLGLQGTMGGGIMNPDSDLDGLLDGAEYYVYGTSPLKMDTDKDGYSDGLEVSLGLDPLTFTSKHDFELALAVMRGVSTIRVMIPLTGARTYQDTQVSVANFTPFQDVWFRYNNGTGWSNNISLSYNPAAGMWQSTGHRWSTGNISLEVYGRNYTGVIHATTAHFVVLPGDTPFPWHLVALAGGVVGLVVVLGVVDHKTKKVRGTFRWLGRKVLRRGGAPSKGKSADGGGGGGGGGDGGVTEGSTEEAESDSKAKSTKSTKKGASKAGKKGGV
ncbi:MAG: hypothetical protein HXY34_06560 [Candidatus Thorarchaeota archaeon]|nr:hypothetical protein [Candidatus Thorarchaeota archaeon]